MTAGSRRAPRMPAADFYKQELVLNAPPLKLVRLVYDRALSCMRHADRAIDAQDRSALGTQLNRAHALISELQQALDHEGGGEIAKQLDQLYEYVLWCLSEINREGSRARLDSAIGVMQTLQEAWDEVNPSGVDA